MIIRCNLPDGTVRSIPVSSIGHVDLLSNGTVRVFPLGATEKSLPIVTAKNGKAIVGVFDEYHRNSPPVTVQGQPASLFEAIFGK